MSNPKCFHILRRFGVMIICAARLASFLHFALSKRAAIERATGHAVDKGNNAFYERPPLEHKARPVVLIDCEFCSLNI